MVALRHRFDGATDSKGDTVVSYPRSLMYSRHLCFLPTPDHLGRDRRLEQRNGL
jgi:hypothetical protein